MSDGAGPSVEQLQAELRTIADGYAKYIASRA